MSTVLRHREGLALVSQLKTLALALAFAALVGGCGGASSATDSTEVTISSISKSDFIRRADVICGPEKARLAKAVSAYQEKHLNEPSVDTVSGAVRAVIRPLLTSQVERLREVGAPRADAAELERFFAALLNAADEIVVRKSETFEEAQSMLEPAAAIARRYGIDQCAFSILG